MSNKIYLEANIELHKETAALRERASKIINLPDGKNKQPDLQYFSAIFVSSGENLNHAYFLPSELIQAEGTIINKALDVEHKEDEIIGHIYERAFMDKEGNPLSIEELANKVTAEVDRQEMHVAIAGILYKARFPNIAEEVASGQWKVSMEAYFDDFDVKVGDMILSRKEAEALGLASEGENIFGRLSKVLKNGKNVAEGALTRVLRGIVFSGCGIVKNPANPPSVILETAKAKRLETDDGTVVFTVDADNKVTSINIEEGDNELKNKDKSEIEKDDTVGICVSYKRRVYAGDPIGPDTEIIHEDWCSLYDEACTSFSRDTTCPECLKNQRDKVAYVSKVAKAHTEKLLNKKILNDKREVLVDKLTVALENAAKYQRRR